MIGFKSKKMGKLGSDLTGDNSKWSHNPSQAKDQMIPPQLLQSLISEVWQPSALWSDRSALTTTVKGHWCSRFCWFHSSTSDTTFRTALTTDETFFS